MTKRLADMNDDEMNAYMIEARAYAEDKARDDLKAERARGNFPELTTRNGLTSAKRKTPFLRKIQWGRR